MTTGIVYAGPNEAGQSIEFPVSTGTALDARTFTSAIVAVRLPDNVEVEWEVSITSATASGLSLLYVPATALAAGKYSWRAFLSVDGTRVKGTRPGTFTITTPAVKAPAP